MTYNELRKKHGLKATKAGTRLNKNGAIDGRTKWGKSLKAQRERRARLHKSWNTGKRRTGKVKSSGRAVDSGIAVLLTTVVALAVFSKGTTVKSLIKPVVKIKLIPIAEAKEVDTKEAEALTIPEIINSYDWDAEKMLAVCKSENGYRRGYFMPTIESPANSNGTRDYGVCQINSSHLRGLCADMSIEDLKTAEKNIECGYRIYTDRAKWDTDGCYAWTDCWNGNYNEFMK